MSTPIDTSQYVPSEECAKLVPAPGAKPDRAVIADKVAKLQESLSQLGEEEKRQAEADAVFLMAVHDGAPAKSAQIMGWGVYADEHVEFGPAGDSSQE